MAPRARPARFAKSTKAVKATAREPSTMDATEVISDSEEERERERTRMRVSGNQDNALVTPTRKSKRAKMSEEEEEEEGEVQILVTPVKGPSSSSSTTACFPSHLPTPPITPTISLTSPVDDNDDEEEEATSPTASTSSSHANVYARARALLRLSAHDGPGSSSSSSSANRDIVGRSIEREQLDRFLRANLPSLHPTPRNGEEIKPARVGRGQKKALYVSGSPGTGKTALLSHVLSDLQDRAIRDPSRLVRVAFLNCASVHRPEDIWARLLAELGLDNVHARSTSGRSRKGKHTSEQDAFTNAVMRPGFRYLVVLDELDHLLSTPSSSSLLSSLFALALEPSSALLLIGIANSLDLTQRLFASLAAIPRSTILSADEEGAAEEDDCHPELLHFRPFQPDEMVQIAKTRLATLHDGSPTKTAKQEGALSLPIMMPAALELAAKKVAAVTGDLRSFLSLIRKAVEIFEGEQRKRLEGASSSSSSTSAGMKRRHFGSRSSGLREDVLARFSAADAPKLTPAHILKATRVVSLFSAPSSSSSSSPTSGAPGLGQGNGPNSRQGTAYGRVASAGGSLSAVAQSSTALLDAKIGELNLHQRLVLTSFLVALQNRAMDASLPWQQQQQHYQAGTSSPSSPGFGERMTPSELHGVYRKLLGKEDVLHPVGSSEMHDLIAGLHTRGLVGHQADYFLPASPAPSSFSAPSSGNRRAGTSPSPRTLAPPMLRRTSSSSSAGAGSSGSARSSRSPSPRAASQAPLILLFPVAALRASVGSAAPLEAAGMCARILEREERRVRRIKAGREMEDHAKRLGNDAPREGWSGDGLKERGDYVGKRENMHVDADEEDETLPNGKGGEKLEDEDEDGAGDGADMHVEHDPLDDW